MVQDLVHYCTTTETPGFLLFMDQDQAYPRVRWQYLERTMQTMRIPPELIALVKTMYNDSTLHFKVNGHALVKLLGS